MKNDLEKVVLPRYPELSRIKELLLEAGAVGSLMTGSGPTVFGVYDDPDRRDEALNKAAKGRLPELEGNVGPTRLGIRLSNDSRMQARSRIENSVFCVAEMKGP